jgi:pimeloyl-ACP methyl ester carboxylesterase
MDDKETEFVEIDGGRIAYQVIGNGPLVVLSPGMADTRESYRFLAPLIAEAGYRVASVDLRGHGESSTGWSSYSRADTAGDLIEVIKKIGGPAVIVGQSFSGGSATIAAATHHELVSAIVEIDPFTRPAKISLSGMLRNASYRRGGLLLTLFVVTRRVSYWSKYLDVAYPGKKPADWNTWLAALRANLSEPGRMKAALAMATSKAVDAEAQIANVTCPTLVIMGTKDSDWVDPEAEATALVGLFGAGLGHYEMIEGAGHYPHAQYPQQVANVLVPFLTQHARA